MKVLKKIRFIATILIIALFTGCAGITEANLSEVESADTPAVTTDTEVQTDDAPGYFHSADDEEIIDTPPPNKYRDR